MKHLFLFSFLTLSLLAKSQTETFMRIHQPNNQVLDIPISQVDSVTYFTQTFLQNNLALKIQQDPELTKVNGALIIANIKDTLSKPGAFTFFTPVNESLDSLKLVIDKTSPSVTAQNINQTIRYHIAKGTYRSSDIPPGAKNIKVFTINTPQDSLFVTKAPNGSIYVNGVKVDDAKKDITAANGVIHKLVNNKSTKEYGFLYSPSKLNAYDFIKSIKGGNNGLDSLAKMIDRAATADPNLISAVKNNAVTVAAPVNSEMAKLVQAFGGDINKISPSILLLILRNHILPSREYIINLAIATTQPAAGTPTLSGNKLGYTIAQFNAFGGAQLPAFYILKEKPVPVIAADNMVSNGVLHLIYGVILDR